MEKLLDSVFFDNPTYVQFYQLTMRKLRWEYTRTTKNKVIGSAKSSDDIKMPFDSPERRVSFISPNKYTIITSSTPQFISYYTQAKYRVVVSTENSTW